MLDRAEMLSYKGLSATGQRPTGRERKMTKATWIETAHTTGWFCLMAGKKEIATVRRCRPKKTKRGYRYSYMAVTKFCCIGGMPGALGMIFKTKREAFDYAAKKAGAL